MLADNKWWVYQKERFPFIAHGPLILAFSASAVCFSSLLREGTPSIQSLMVAFCSSFVFFLQLRIADEFKDFEEDSRYRPYRPVPRGWVTLRELGIVFILVASVQLLLALLLSIRLVPILVITWGYLACMSKEFGVRQWLKKRPLMYMITHMAIMPLIDLYATACDWVLSQPFPPKGLLWFLLVSFFNGMVIEIGRKIRAPEAEETGVETYTFLWGRGRAIFAWWIVLGLTGSFAFIAAGSIQFRIPMTITLAVLLGGALAAGVRFLRNPVTARARFIETYSGIWTLFMYLFLGIVPLLVKRLG